MRILFIYFGLSMALLLGLALIVHGRRRDRQGTTTLTIASGGMFDVDRTVAVNDGKGNSELMRVVKFDGNQLTVRPVTDKEEGE